MDVSGATPLAAGTRRAGQRRLGIGPHAAGLRGLQCRRAHSQPFRAHVEQRLFLRVQATTRLTN